MADVNSKDKAKEAAETTRTNANIEEERVLLPDYTQDMEAKEERMASGAAATSTASILPDYTEDPQAKEDRIASGAAASTAPSLPQQVIILLPNSPKAAGTSSNPKGKKAPKKSRK